jgi:CO/xanthine dehydrogenase Mo-binding subunit
MSIVTPRPAERTRTVGTSVPRADAAAKVAGMTDYAANHRMAGMLSVAVARSARPHARLLGVDVDAARAVEGVVDVVTGADLAAMLGERLLTGPAFQDQPILAHERVRFVGEPVAAVVARDAAVARAGARLVEVAYEDLEPVHDVDQAAAGPPFVHDELRPSGVFRDLAHLAGVRDTNVCYDFRLVHGDVEATLAAAPRTVDGDYWTPPAHHVTIELPCTLAWVEGERVEVISATQTPSYVRQMLADVLGLPLNRVRVRVPALGGGFGAKMYDKLEPLVAVLAWRLRRPVQWIATRDEHFVMTSRHGVAVRCRMGADEQGRLVAADADVRYETGAYADIGPRIAAKSGLVATGPYRTPSARIRSRCIYTNKPSAGPYRGFGVPQLVFAHESAMDELARACGADPYRFRRENLLREGDEASVGTPMHSADLVGCLDRVAEAVEWDTPMPPSDGRLARGRGIAVGLKAVLTPTIAGAVVQLNDDASATVLINTVDMGQGSDTIMAQIAAEVLALGAEQVRVARPDTDGGPYDTITAGSRSTYHMGNAVRLAAGRVREQVLAIAAEQLEADAAELVLEPDGVRRRDDAGPTLPLRRLFGAYFGARGATLTSEARFQTDWVPYDHETGRSPDVTEHWFAGAVGVVLTVDRLTGLVRIEHLAVAGDVGRAINPRLCEQQLVGAAVMGIGHALFDEMVFEDGRLLNDSLLDYQMPSFRDMPDRVTPIVVESPHRTGPFGAKGVGETGILATAPAIGNAIHDALGVRFRRLPITPEAILDRLEGGA